MLRLIVMCLAVALACTNSFAAKSGAKSKSAKNVPAKSKPAKAKALEFKDARDGQTYRLVKIGDRTWFGDNLNFKSEGSYCLDDDENNCMAYGRLYSWDAARSACPSGFRLPKHEDFESLWNAAGADYNAGYLQCGLSAQDDLRLEGRHQWQRYAQVCGDARWQPL